MESICCIFFCSAIECSVMRSCSKFVFQLCSVWQYRKLQKVFVQIKKGIITKLRYRKFQNRNFELRHFLSCRFQVVVLLLLLSEERDEGFSETSWICSITSVLPYIYKKNRTSSVFMLEWKKKVFESLKDFLQNVHNIFPIFFFVFY